MQTSVSAQIGVPESVPVERVRYCLYARKSTESDEKQALSIDSQVKEMLAIAEREGLEIVDIRRESHSAKASGQRPVFNELIRDLNSGRYTGILTWAPDRLSRNAGDLGTLVDLMDEKRLHQIRTYGQSFQNSPSEKFLLMILCSQAKLENDNKSINVKRGLKTRCEMGLWPAPAPMGYLNEMRADRKGYVYVDPERGHIIRQMFEKVAYQKWSGRKVYHWLKFDMNFKSPKGNKGLNLSTIFLILQNPFYYGAFEFPRKSGNWYKGRHEALITKELFDQVQQQMKAQFSRTWDKEFAFTKLMLCGLCGSGICADEKFKKLKNGSISRHCYYGCTKARDKNCKCGYISEDELIEQLIALMDTIDINEVGIKEKIKDEVKKIKRFQQSLLGIKENIDVNDIDIRAYTKYILKDGSITEKRELLGCLTSRITLNQKKISLLHQQ
ncbi:MAG: recombinase family protein [Candidatus Pacebacteria bacterium]|jgi:DNA invertase Pin-like site-specific DNA recombinase|nr:recombinase family protein [Candidatus Paceibacterota bacterium]